MSKKQTIMLSVAVAAVLVAVIVFLGFRMHKQNEKNKQMLELAEMDKREMENEYEQFAITNLPKDIAPFTGSVVIDRNNTAGYGKNAAIAAFTSFDKESKKQSQSIAFSLNGGTTFCYYDLNPVLDIWSTEFRDPTVIWDYKNNRWVMLVAKALEKKVAFYQSPDLKHWTWLSDFGPMGDSERSWECPDMFQVCVDGNPNVKKWVLLISINWAREQYFVGDFNGITFVPDQPNAEPLYVDHGLDYYASRVFQNFDADTHRVFTLGWVNTWDYANTAPSTWGKGIWSLPREYTLRTTSQGLRLYQSPCEALQSLRGTKYSATLRVKPGKSPLREISKMTNTYELLAEITPAADNDDVVGFHLCEAAGRKVVVSYDTASLTMCSGYTITLTTTHTNSLIVSSQDTRRYDRTHFTYRRKSVG